MKGILEGRHDYWIRILESEKGIFCVDKFVSYSFCSPREGFNFIFLPISSILDHVLDLTTTLTRRNMCWYKLFSSFLDFFQICILASLNSQG